MDKISVLFVCMGNICRSPTAEGVFNKLVGERGLAPFFRVDSAGTHAYHLGEAPDLRAQRAALGRGVDLSGLRARRVVYDDFGGFDYLLAMDTHNHDLLMAACPEPYKPRIHYLLDFAPHLQVREVPDPYYGGAYGFERVLDLVEEASAGFLRHLHELGRIRVQQ